MSESGRSESVGPPEVQPHVASSSTLLNNSTWALTVRNRGIQPTRVAAAAPPPEAESADDRGQDGQTQQQVTFEPLSALAVELDGFRDAADGDSQLLSDTCSQRGVDSEEEDDDDDDDDDNEEDGDDDYDEEGEEAEEAGEGRLSKRPRQHALSQKRNSRLKKKQRKEAAGMWADAAFGTNCPGAKPQPDDAASESVQSRSASIVRRAAYKAAFPIKGITCVGCMMVRDVEPVVTFVRRHFDAMAEEALWKQAAYVYIKEVQEPRRRENVETPDWMWKDLRTHFLLHCSDNAIARATTCRDLQTMRQAIKQRLVVAEGKNKQIDQKACEMMLKVINTESRERTLLQGSNLNAIGVAGPMRRPGQGGRGANK